MKCCRRYVSQTFAVNTFRFAIFSLKKPFPTRVFIHRKFLNHFVNIFVKKLLIFLIFQNKNTKMLTNFIIKTFYYMKYSAFPCRLKINQTLCRLRINRHTLTNHNRVNKKNDISYTTVHAVVRAYGKGS